MNQRLTVKQLADLWQIHQDTVYDWARKKKIPAIKLSRGKRSDWRFDVDRVLQWEKENTPFDKI
jgi:excisionase family DNA binding protein